MLDIRRAWMGRPYLAAGWVPVPAILDEAYAGHQESMDGASTMSLRHNGEFVLFGQRHIAETKDLSGFGGKSNLSSTNVSISHDRS